MDYLKNKEEMNNELDHFVTMLNELLPKYSMLLKKKTLNAVEVTTLGDIEYFLMQINSKVTDIKNKLDQDLFGHSIDVYYKVKAKAEKGDNDAIKLLDRLKDSFTESLNGETLILWN